MSARVWRFTCGILPSCLALLVAAGCAKRDRQRQYELEGFAAATLQKLLVLHEEHGDGPLTNVVQVFAMMDLTRPHRAHPSTLQKQFREFGPTAGFKNSIYEKYLVLPPGLTDRTVKGEMILMSAEPFPDLDGRPIRVVISKAGAEDYRQTDIQEARVQEIFTEANIAIPRPVSTPSPVPPDNDYELSYPASTRVRMFFEEFAEILGLGKIFWLPLMLICAVVLITVLILSTWILVRKR